MIIEVPLDSLKSAVAAYNAGAQRIELTSNLCTGGYTPSIGLYKAVKESCPGIQIFVMIRPSVFTFCYTSEEFTTMAHDMQMFDSEGADGFVLGALKPDGSVDVESLRQIIKETQKPLTFHRAFDLTVDWKKAIEDIKSLGFSRILSSGQSDNAYMARNLLKEIVNYGQSTGIIVMPGGGVNIDNIVEIAKYTGAKEIHASGRENTFRTYTCGRFIKDLFESKDQVIAQTNEDLVKIMIKRINKM
ncbi:hypothetical protein GJ496_010447 [Pomphorhynchus laevis]|nr:hypothetical protein GJ496_010447 [Pomphorhynchus laevis]